MPLKNNHKETKFAIRSGNKFGWGHVEFKTSIDRPGEDIAETANMHICVCKVRGRARHRF